MIKHPGYEYQIVDFGLEPTEATEPMYIAAAVANRYSEAGWRTVGIFSAKDGVHNGGLLLERTKRNPHKYEGGYVENQRWHDWVEQYGEIGAWP